MESGVASLGRIPLDVRVGVTGHRWIPIKHKDIAQVVRNALDDAMKAARIPLAATDVGLTVVSALAHGADRIVAKVALELGARLEVVLPFEQATYEKDFHHESLTEFRRLRDQAASVSVVPEASGRDENYLRAGQAIVERVDVLIAIWDGEPARGLGGTAQIVQYAQALFLPTIHLRAVRSGSRITVHPPDPAPDLSNVPLAPKALQQLDTFNRTRLSAAEQADALATLAADIPGDAWMPYFVRADTLALRYQRRYRWSVLLLYLLSAFAVASAGTQLVYFRERPGLAWIEVCILAALLAGVVVTRWQDLLGKWTSARYIAERTRSAMILAAAGAIPAFALVPTGGGIHDWEQDDWAGRTVRELWFRLAGSNERSAAGEIDSTWVQDQITYHRTAHARSSKVQHVTTGIAGGLFFASLVAAFLHGLHFEHLSETVEWISIVAPAIAAAMSGYLAHREVRRQATRSQRVMQDLTKIQRVMEAAPTTNLVPLVEQLDSVLNNDATDWYMTARLHEPELP